MSITSGERRRSLHSLAEDFRRTGNERSKETARKIMVRLKKLAVYPRPDVCYFPAGMGAMKQDGTPVPNGWNRMPAPIVEPLVNYYLACGDQEALEFAKAYAEGIMTGAQPDGIKIKADGDIDNGHSHATMHALWGIAHLGVVTGDERYTAFAKRSWDFMLSRGTGAGWFPAMPERVFDRRDLPDVRHDVERGDDRPRRTSRVLRLCRKVSAQPHQSLPVRCHAGIRGRVQDGESPGRRGEDPAGIGAMSGHFRAASEATAV